MFNIKLYSVNEISWLVTHSKVLDSDFLNYPCHEGSTARWAAFIIKNNIKTSDVNTIFIYLFGVFMSFSTLYRSYHDG